jgi:hypothetical protein
MQNKYYKPNRFYHRGSDPSGVANIPSIDPSCDVQNKCVYGATFPDRVVSHDNEYADDTPKGDLGHMVFSIFGTRPDTDHDINQIFHYYKQVDETKDAEEKFGPFDQININIAGEDQHNYNSWTQAWKGYGEDNQFRPPIRPLYESPYLLRLSHDIARIFLKSINNAVWSLGVNDPNFHLAKNKILRVSRSTVTGYLRFTMDIGLSRDTTAKLYYFRLQAYTGPAHHRYDRVPHPPQIYLGNTQYIGSSTTDKMLLPPGKEADTFGRSGRPLNPAYAKRSELMSDQEVKRRFWEHLYKTRTFKPRVQWSDDIPNMPFWFKSRLRRKRPWDHVGYATTSAMFPYRTPEQTLHYDKF